VSDAVTVLVTTRNRRDDLARALRSVLDQSVPCEIVVVDDGSTDDTAEFVRKEFPTARLFSHREGLGPIVRRNEGVESACGEIVVLLDDDARLGAPTTLAEIVAGFREGGPEIGAIALPTSDDPVDVRAADDDIYVTGLFRAGMVAFRRAAYLDAGGFRELLRIAGEERDLALRLLDRGYHIRAGRLSVPLQHRQSATRDLRERDRFGRRNDLLIGWLAVPAVSLPGYFARMLGHAVFVAVRTRRPVLAVQGIVDGVRACIAHRGLRAPVTRRTYRLSRVLTGRAVALHAVLGMDPQ
jgi:glycosyltransferase involved in cell wall biosynthesis